MSSASAIADAIIANLNAASVMGACAVSTDYSVLNTNSGCCGVVEWTEVNSVPVTMGPTSEEGFSHIISLFVRDNGDGSAVMKNTLGLIDKTVASIESDPTLQGTVELVLRVAGRRTPNEAIEIGGHLWLPMVMQIDTVDYP